MSRSSQSKEKYGIRSEIVSQDNFNEGTSARTRPYSYDEILCNRRNKELSEDAKVVANNKSGEHNVKNVDLDCLESDKDYRLGRDYLPLAVKKTSDEDGLKRSSRSEGDETREKKDRSVKEKERQSHEVKTKVDDKLAEDKDGMVDRLGRGRRKYDEQPRDDSKNEFGRESKIKDRHHEIERNRSRNSLGKDKSRDDSKHGNDRENERKDRNQEDGNYRDRNIVKKHDLRKRTNPEYSYRREIKNLSQSHDEKSRAKRRRSRSRDHEDKQKMSVLPREYKHESYHGREHEESVLDKKHSDVDRSTIPSNDLSNHHGEKLRAKGRWSRSRDNEDKQKISVVPKEHKYTSYHSREHEKSVLVKKHSDVDKSTILSNSLCSHPDEKSRAKRRRSRSRDNEDKQKISVVPKEHKYTSYHSREHEKSVLDKKHSDVDKSTIPSNSLSNHRDEKSRAKRRRSRSRDNEDKQKISVVPKEHKYSSYHSREHEESILDKKHSDVDESTIPSNSLSNHRDDKSRAKRRRSRSRDHEDKQKMTFLPKEHKHTFYRSREHEEPVLDKKHSDVDKSTIQSNGLRNHHDENSRETRRRSRSRDHEDKQKMSVLPKEYKHTSYPSRQNEESVSDKKHSDVDKSTIPSNGLSNHHRRNVDSKSGLGGYSPRKRLTEVGAKTPPTARSPEKKRVGWDLPPVGKDNSFSESLLSKLQYVDPTVLINMSILTSVTGVSGNTSSMRENTPFIDAVELTHATRPFRSLHVENLPAAATEKEVIEYFNNSLLSSGVNNIQEIQPCISCNIYKDRGQALVEFLTPLDATKAISLNDSSFSGSILKIRRPKDFVGVSTGIPEKSAAVDAISDVVNNSPHKIFIGGISKLLSSEMILEIASVFGTLKAYHFKVDENLDEPCAYLEYVDRLITPKACAGLSGMKLGGKVLTALLATPDAPLLENNEILPVHRIPEHAKPLLENPTEVLKLKNLFDLEGFLLLSESEIEEVLDDVRLECARFGTVKSLNLVKLNSSCITISESNPDTDHKGYSAQSLSIDVINNNIVKSGEVADCETAKNSKILISGNIVELRKDENLEDFKCIDVGFANDCVKDEDETCKTDQFDCQTTENLNHLKGEKCELEFHADCSNDKIQQKEFDLELKSMTEKETFKLSEVFGGPNTDATEIDDIKEICNVDQVFELGCVFVEFGRTEASCMAANCLHGRLFEDRVISLQYIALDLYRQRFPK